MGLATKHYRYSCCGWQCCGNQQGDTATAAITGAGLVVGTVTQQSSSTLASGFVSSESPAAGTNVASSTAVNLVVSTGGGGGIDSLTLGAHLSALIVGLRRARKVAKSSRAVPGADLLSCELQQVAGSTPIWLAKAADPTDGEAT
jgi:hypothetical protein